MDSKNKVVEWQNRLQDVFLQHDVVGGQLLEVISAEQEFKYRVIGKYHGHLVLLDSFQAFFYQTLGLSERNCLEIKNENEHETYLFLRLQMCHLFRCIRACENLLLIGHPMAGYSLLRDVKTIVFHLCALGNKLTTFEKLLGVNSQTSDSKAGTNDESSSIKELTKNREKEEGKAIRKLFLEGVALNPSTKETLEDWGSRFHSEVHGGQITKSNMYYEYSNLGLEFPVIPRENELLESQYLNRIAEISWMILRLIPLLQIAPGLFGEVWIAKWHTLDDSFREYELGLKSLEKPKLNEIVDAIIEFIDKKLGFPPDQSSFKCCIASP